MLLLKTRHLGNKFCYFVVPGLVQVDFSLFLRRQLLMGVLSLEAQVMIMLKVVLKTSDQNFSLYICLSQT